MRTIASDSWRAAPGAPRIRAGEVHVWRVELSNAAQSEALSSLLSDDERERTNRFRRARDAHRFATTRGATRRILGAYVGVDPRSLRFTSGARGAPNLADCTSLEFSVTHAGDLALIAVAARRPVGVDVERVSTIELTPGLLDRCCTSAERVLLDALAPAERRRRFSELWVKKEAVLKATGDGLFRSPSGVDVSTSGSAVALEEHWSVKALDAAPEYASAVAARGSAWRLSCWTLEP